VTKAINIAAVEKATGKSWEQWLKFFDSIKAKNLSHKEIARKVYESGTPGWWSQMLTVAYEQHIGRRVPGQDCDGEFNVSASKTLKGTMDEALERWIKLTKNREEFSDIAISRVPNISKTEKWRYWHCGLADGSRISVSIYQKSPDKVSLGLGHEKLESVDHAEHWRAYWKDLLNQL
jgi:hypothetical protein